MAQNKKNVPKYVYDIPYFERMELCKILDQNDKWEELGGIHMNFDMLTIQTLRREVLRGNSPTDELLTKWGHQNHTILELFVLLSKMQHYQAMLVIKQFVDAEYHKLIYEGEQNLCRIFKEKQNIKAGTSKAVNPKFPNCSGEKNEHCLDNNYNNISANFNFTKPSNNMPDKIAFIENHTNNIEKKIINCEVPGNSDINAENINTNKNNDQTILMKGVGENEPTETVGPNQPKFLKLPIPKDKNVSEMSCVAESVGILPVITFKELELATNGWDHSTILGKGGFGTVYKGTWKNTLVAIKRTKNSETDENHSIQIHQILGELKMLNSYRHDNILPLYGFSMDGEDPCLIYQFMPNGSLEDRLLCRHGTKPLSWYQRHNIATGTARGIQFLHTIGEKPLIHGDIKSANILLDSNFEPKIGDFGLAREGPHNHYTHMKVSRVHGTRPYLPDEFLRHKKFSTKVDTHSFGIVLFELATGLRAYDDQRQHKFLKDLVENTNLTQLSNLADKKCGVDEHQTFSNLISLGKCCVSKKPKDRPEMVIVLQELNAMAVKRDLMTKVQTMIRQNSLTPSTPFEMQAIHDHLSQQKRVSPTFSNATQFRAPTRAISPLQPTFYPDLNVFNNAASLEAQAAYSVNVANNNPFLPMVPVSDKDKTSKDPSITLNKNEDPAVSEAKVISKQVEGSFKDNQEANVQNQTPVISVFPPSAPQTSSVSSQEETEEPQIENISSEDSDFEYTSDIENFLPLISVLGVKGKNEGSLREDKEEESKENMKVEEHTERNATSGNGEHTERNATSGNVEHTERNATLGNVEHTERNATLGNVEFFTSAKGKPLWILENPR